MMISTSGAASDDALTSAAPRPSMSDVSLGNVLLDVAEIREQAPPPEPLREDRLRKSVWLVPAIAAASIGLWCGDSADLIAGPAGGDGLETRWVELTASWGWAARVVLAAGAATNAALVAVVGTQLSRRRTGLFAGLLYALLPGSAAVVLGALVLPVTLSLCALLLAVRLARRPTRGNAAAYALTLVALGIVAPLALVASLPHVLLQLRGDRPHARRILSWAVATGSAFLAVGVAAAAGMVAGSAWHPPVINSVSPVGGWVLTSFGSSLAAASVITASLLGLMRGRGDVAVVGCAAGSTLAVFAGVACAASGVREALPIVVPIWCLAAGVALSRVRLTRAVCAVGLTLAIGLPTQIQVRNPKPASTSMPTVNASLLVDQVPRGAVARR
jgi:mannosyltransferase